MKRWLYIFIAFAVISATSVGLRDGCIGTTNNLGIYNVPGWAHGVALCENAPSPKKQIEGGVLWNDGIATYTVNTGHENDPQVAQLIANAHTGCAQFYP